VRGPCRGVSLKTPDATTQLRIQSRIYLSCSEFEREK
jgi:hypothetical protein